MVRAAEFEPR